MLEVSRVYILIALLALPTPAGAQLLPSFDDYAAAIVAGMGPRWTGPRVPWPTEHDRPPSEGSLASFVAPVRVHGTTDDPARLERALRGVVAMHDHLRRLGWEALPLDTDGPDEGFDLYLVDGVATWEARSDGPYLPAPLDTARAHAVLGRGLDGPRLEACAAEAYAGALLLALDPAEAPAWRRATAGYLGFTLTGHFDACAEDVARAQLDPARTWVGEEANGTGGALLLALLADRHDGGGGTFVRELWNMSRQRTWDGEDLRASPDLWEALARTIELVGLSFADTLSDVAIARATPSVLRSTAHVELPTIRAMPRSLGAFVASTRTVAALPSHLPVAPPIAQLGSTYARLDVRGARPGTRVRVWMRGEIATRWALVVVGFDEAGREVARVRAPLTERADNAYVPFELEPRIADLLVAVTNVGEGLPDADLADVAPHACRIVLDVASGTSAAAPP